MAASTITSALPCRYRGRRRWLVRLTPGGIAAPQAGAAYVNVRPEHALTVTKSGTGSGKVTSDPAGIDSGAVCQASYPEGTIVPRPPMLLPGRSSWGGSLLAAISRSAYRYCRSASARSS